MNKDKASRARRAHKKSRAGCLSCKKRHIRCDERTPQCENCEERGYDCDYPLPKRSRKDRPTPLIVPSVIRFENHVPEDLAPERKAPEQKAPSQKAERALSPPIPAGLSPYKLSALEMDVMTHFTDILKSLEKGESMAIMPMTAQLPICVPLAFAHDIVMHSLLSLSASHMAWMKHSQQLVEFALQHQTAAYSKLQTAIENFSEDTADLLMIATSMLSWQTTDWRSWSVLLRGNDAIINAMRPWAKKSIFSNIIAQNIQDLEEYRPPIRPDTNIALENLAACVANLRSAKSFTNRTHSQRTLYRMITATAQSILKSPPGPTAEEQFEIIFPLRGWLSLMPTTVFDGESKDVCNLVSFSLYYSTVLACTPFLDQVTYFIFRSFTAEPVREIYRFLGYLYRLEMLRKERGREEDELDGGRERDKRIRQLAEALKLVKKAAEIVGHY